MHANSRSPCFPSDKAILKLAYHVKRNHGASLGVARTASRKQHCTTWLEIITLPHKAHIDNMAIAPWAQSLTTRN